MHWANVRLTGIWLREGSRSIFYFVPWSSPPSQHSLGMYVHGQYHGAQSGQRWACRSGPSFQDGHRQEPESSCAMSEAAVTWTHFEKMYQFLLHIVAYLGCAGSFWLISYHILTSFVLILCGVLEPTGTATCKILRKSVSQVVEHKNYDKCCYK